MPGARPARPADPDDAAATAETATPGSAADPPATSAGRVPTRPTGPAATTPRDVDPGEPPAPPRRRRRGRRIALTVLVVLLLLGAGGVAGAGLYMRSIEGDIERVDAFEQVPEESRPAVEEAAAEALNFLVLGSDTRDPSNTGGSRSDTIIVLHLPSDRSSAQLISIPRDTWVDVPRSASGRGGVPAKINAAFAWGGAPLMVQTVEAFTGVRIDHVVMVDFAGFKEIIDTLGGVEIDVERAFTSTHSLNPGSVRRFPAGPQTMDGAAALDYARERYAFADGDFARIRHQQQVIQAILSKTAEGGLLTNPARLNSFLRAAADAVAVDDTLRLFDMATDLRHLRSENLTFYTSPTTGTGTRGDQSVVLPDAGTAKRFYDAVRRDDVSAMATIGTVR